MFVNRYVNRKCVMWVLTKKSFKVTSNPPNLTVLFDEFSGWIREFAVPTMAAATARAGHRTPMALHRYSFGLHLIWNRVFEPFSMELWWKSQSRKCWPRSGFEDFIFFFCQMAMQQPAGRHETILFWRFFFFQIHTATKRKSRYSGKTQQIVHRFWLFTIISCNCSIDICFLATNNGSAPVFFWSSFDLKSSFWAFF